MVMCEAAAADEATRTVQRKRAELFGLEMAHANKRQEDESLYNQATPQAAVREMTPWELHNAEGNAALRVRQAMEAWLELPTLENMHRMQDATNDYPSHWARGRKRVL